MDQLPDILLVEDEDVVRAVVARFLEHAGYRVRSAATASAALHAIHDGAALVPLIVTDVRMPGMDGVAFAHEVRRQHPAAKFLFIAGHPEDGQDRVPGPLLPKPFDEGALVHEVRQLLGW